MRRISSLLAMLDKKYFNFGRSLNDLPTYSMFLQRSGQMTRLASSRAKTLQIANARVTWTCEYISYQTWCETDP